MSYEHPDDTDKDNMYRGVEPPPNETEAIKKRKAKARDKVLMFVNQNGWSPSREIWGGSTKPAHVITIRDLLDLAGDPCD